MKKLKVIKELNTEISKIPSACLNDKIIIAAFQRIKKELDITKELNITDNIYLQPFKLEYTDIRGGLKDYDIDFEKQKLERGDEYIKLVVKKDKKLIAIKSFGLVSKLDKTIFDMLLLLVRLSQYIIKNRELYSLEIHMLQLLKH